MDFTIFGNWKDVGKKQHYFAERGCWVDCRGELIIHPTANFGYGVKIFTASHDIADGKLGKMILKKVEVCANAWIASMAILYNCYIGEGAVVSVGSVVSSMRVEPHTMVAGNPAQVIAVFDGKEWVRNGNVAEVYWSSSRLGLGDENEIWAGILR